MYIVSKSSPIRSWQEANAGSVAETLRGRASSSGYQRTANHFNSSGLANDLEGNLIAEVRA